MLTMAQQEYIKDLREREDLPINTIAKKMNIDWRTVKKYADKDNWNTVIKERVKNYPILGPYIDIIDTWLEEDLRVHKKQRHTQIRVYQRLVAECGYTGGKRTVTQYVSTKKKSLIAPSQKFIDLNHPGGEAQVDFGTAEVSSNQKVIQVKYLVMSFPYSNAAYLWFLPSENIECFLTGLQNLFHLVGGVPKKIWFDNLSSAVVKVEKNYKRKTTENFSHFALHYGFESVFCNVGKGSDKGNVENKVGCTRRNWMVPLPTFTSWTDINQQMKIKAEAYLQEDHYEKNQSVYSLFEEEKTKLLYLPEQPFDIYKLDATVLDKYGRVRFEGQHHPIAKGRSQEPVLLKIQWDQVEVLDNNCEKIGSFSRAYSFREHNIEWIAELKCIQKKPRAITYALIYSQLPSAIQSYLGISDIHIVKIRIGWIINWLHGGYTIDQINKALINTSTNQLDRQDVLYHSLYRVAHPDLSIDILEEEYTPSELKGYIPDLKSYDQLTASGARI